MLVNVSGVEILQTVSQFEKERNGLTPSSVMQKVMQKLGKKGPINFAMQVAAIVRVKCACFAYWFLYSCGCHSHRGQVSIRKINLSVSVSQFHTFVCSVFYHRNTRRCLVMMSCRQSTNTFNFVGGWRRMEWRSFLWRQVIKSVLLYRIYVFLFLSSTCIMYVHWFLSVQSNLHVWTPLIS